MTADPRRLDIGYGTWSGDGNGHGAISREAINTCLPFSTEELKRQHELAVIGFSAPGDLGEFNGWHERLLLEAFGVENLSDHGRGRLFELRTKFPEQVTAIPSRGVDCVNCIDSPIPSEELKDFSDDQWLAAMQQYNFGWDGSSTGADPRMKGSAVELSRELQPLARQDRVRFANLTVQMEDAIRPEYFEAILDGICGIENLSKEARELDDQEFAQIVTEVVLGAIRRLDRLPNRPCGRSICRAFQKLADRVLSESDLDVFCHYAINDADPPSDDSVYQNSQSHRLTQDAHLYGYNSVRGHAARAIEALLFADYSRAASLVPLLEQMVSDKSIGVRACVIEALRPVFNHDRDKAVHLFYSACEHSPLMIGSRPVEDFVRYASSTHYSTLRTTLHVALESSSEEAVTAAARQTCLAAFTDQLAEADAAIVRTGTDKMRRAAAEVYSYNVGDATVAKQCEQHLCDFFFDPSEEVRTAASFCFAHLDDADFGPYTNLIQTYIESPAFPAQHDQLLRRLEHSTWQLPEITIRLAEAFVKSCGTEAGDISTAAAGDAPTVSKLVVRLYSQSNDESIRATCLDLIDKMELIGFYGIDSQLAEHDR